MKKVYTLLKDYHQEHFQPKIYSIFAAFLLVSLLLNYHFDFENQYIDAYQRTPLYWLLMYLWQLAPFLVICGVMYWQGAAKDWLGTIDFWLKALVGFGLLALYRSFYLHESIVGLMTGADFYFVKRCIRWASSLVTIMLPLWLLGNYFDRYSPVRNYGLNLAKFDIKPYLQILAVAMLFVAIGSFFGDIQQYYPRFANSSGAAFAAQHQLPVWLPVAIYEFCYGLDFLAVEMFFRGFLVFGFVRLLGGHAILPMVATYCFLHFGKPMPEAAASVVGGYVLGVVAYKTRNIMGGIIIHVGIAWGMELLGWLHRMR